MCFGGPDVPEQKPVAAAPTPTNLGESESVKEAKDKDKKRQRAAAGYQQNILGGSAGLSDSNVGKKQLLGQ